MRTRLSLLTALLLTPLAALPAAETAKARPRPNVILIMADNLGYAGLGCYGQKLILTPAIDHLAAEGMRFTDFYSSNTVCVPSRVGMLLGMHPGHAPIRDNFTPHLPDFAGYMKGYPAELWPPTTRTSCPEFRPS